MSEATTTNSTSPPAFSPGARRRAMKIRNEMTLERKMAIAKESVGMDGKQLEALAAKYGVSVSSVYGWRKRLGGTAPATAHVSRYATAATRQTALERWRASGQPLTRWAKANGFHEATMRGWMGKKKKKKEEPAAKSLRLQGGGRGPSRKNFTVEFKRQIAERSQHMGIMPLSAETGVSKSNINRWRREVGLSRRNARQSVAEPSALSPDDQALLEGHGQQKTRDKNLLERMRRLEKENLVLKANLAYAIEAGYMDLFDINRMFTGKKG